MADDEPSEEEEGCPCDRPEFPALPDIPAGLTALPRQLAGFPEYRLAQLREIRTHRLFDDPDALPPLADWRAREGDDIGVMLLEMWAYVLDVIGFYDERIANETYLRTAHRPESLGRLVEWIGYHPRPGLAARAVLALLAEKGKGPVALPEGTAFRSGAFGDEPPQVFETGTPAVIDPRRNEWTLAPIRSSSIGPPTYYMEPREAAIERGDLVLIKWGDDADSMVSAWVKEAGTTKALDGKSYVTVGLETSSSLNGATIEDTYLLKPTLTASATSVGSHLTLDSVYKEIEVGDPVIVSLGSSFCEGGVTAISSEREVDEEQYGEAFGAFAAYGVNAPAITKTKITIDSDPSLGGDEVRVHFRFVEAGRLTRPAKHRIGRSDLDPQRDLEDISEPLEPEAEPKEVLLSGADGMGTRLDASVSVNGRGKGTLEPAGDDDPFSKELRTPVKVFGNLVEVTRGESVRNEVLGSGDASLPFQKFTLSRKPLTYLADPTAPNGRGTTLEVRVNGLLWMEVPSFYGTEPGDEVYIVRQDLETEESIVTFGDGKTGARLPTGVNNVVAGYRFGAGAAAPPAHSITQMARPVAGIRSVESPVAAGGGKDGDRPKDLRRNAPVSALLLGRAVSLQDFEALAREFGVVQARAGWAWDETAQRAAVTIWFIPNSESAAEENERELKKALLGQADPNTPLVVRQAEPVPAELIVDLVTDPRRDSDEVEQAVAEALGDPETGLLSMENIPIGGRLFRSAIFEQILSVEGAESVRAQTFNNSPFGGWRDAAEGTYHNFLPDLTVGNTAAGEILFARAKRENNTNYIALDGRVYHVAS